MRAWNLRIAPVVLCCGLLTACEEDQGGATVLDAVVQSTDLVVDAMDADPDAWLVAAPTGSEVDGELAGASTGKITVTGWRSSMEYLPGSSQYLSFAEKLFLDMDGFDAGGITVSGSVVVTRHSLDYGTNDKIDDASRTTHYVGNVITNGAVQGSFTLDVHANASGTTLWTCGLVNQEETGSGRCY